MNRRRAVLGLCMFSALMLSAVAAQGASAVVKGTTAFTCRNVGRPEGGFADAHCKFTEVGGPYAHVAIAESNRTEVTTSNEETEGKTRTLILKSTVSGTAIELQATGVHGEGWAENSKTEAGEHYAHGTGTSTYTGVTVTKPASKGCKVYTDNGGTKGEEGVIHTEPVTVTTQGQEHSLTFEPDTAAGATAFLHFIIEGCSIAGLNTTYTVTGKVTGVPNGATTNFNEEEITTKESLFLNERKAAIEGTTTGRGRTSPEGTTVPLSTTTVET